MAFIANPILVKAQFVEHCSLVKMAKVESTYIGVIERGEQSPTLETIGKIARALDIKIKEFFLFPFEEDVVKEEGLAIMEIAQLLKGKGEKTIKMILKVTKDIIESLEE
ncbi:helix-turn-helix transcriptional regulator [bacterium]|nr:helix-turn-helix transcriptional regulator [bacterium]